MPIEAFASQTSRAFAGLLFAGLASCASGQPPQAAKADFDGRTMQWCDKTGPDTDCSELARFAPAGMTIRARARGDLDGDGDEDLLIVVEHDTDQSASIPRGLLLLRRDAAGDLHESLNSPEAILCRKCGGMMGDPLQEVRVGHGDFTLRFEGGSRELWSSEYRFEHAHDRELWLLADIVHSGFDRADGRIAERRLTVSDFGEVSLKSFHPEDYPADALP